MDLRGSKIKISRRLGVPITRKSIRFMERRPNPPGQHGANAGRKLSDYGKQLMEKQKLRAQYNISEKQMRIGLEDAVSKKGSSIDNLVRYFEVRLDAVVYRSGFAKSIFAARQFVSHCHVLVNDKKVNIPSYRIKVGDTVSIRPVSRTIPILADLAKLTDAPTTPDYLTVDLKSYTCILKYLPTRDEVPVECNVQSVIEFYSR